MNNIDFPAIIPTTEEVMEDLRGLTFQYCSVENSTERAARHSRVLDGETRDMMAQTPPEIIDVVAAASLQPLGEYQRAITPEVQHFSQDLPQLHDQELHPDGVPKKKWERPPLKKRTGSTPTKLQRENSRKRKTIQLHKSPNKKSIVPAQIGDSTANRTNPNIQMGTDRASTSKMTPTISLIPAMVINAPNLSHLSPQRKYPSHPTASQPQAPTPRSACKNGNSVQEIGRAHV